MGLELCSLHIAEDEKVSCLFYWQHAHSAYAGISVTVGSILRFFSPHGGNMVASMG